MNVYQEYGNMRLLSLASFYILTMEEAPVPAAARSKA